MSQHNFNCDSIPRLGYGWISTEAKIKEIWRYLNEGRTEAWIISEARKFGLWTQERPTERA